jgi:ankyrin repeat protein
MLKLNTRTQNSGDTLLHLAVSSSSTLHSNSFLDGDGPGGDPNTNLNVFPSLEVTDFILKCGFDIHSRNDLLETPLHIASKRENFSPKVTQKLLENGAHLDIPDSRDICPKDILKAHPAKINLVPYVSLKCLAAQVVLRENIPVDIVPENIKELLQSHRMNSNNSPKKSDDPALDILIDDFSGLVELIL